MDRNIVALDGKRECVSATQNVGHNGGAPFAAEMAEDETLSGAVTRSAVAIHTEETVAGEHAHFLGGAASNYFLHTDGVVDDKI